MSEPSLFDARLNGINQSGANADTDWKETALDGVYFLARTRHEFTIDDVRLWLDRCEVETHNLMALGSIMRTAARNGWIRNTRRVTRSTYGTHHRDIPIWETSL